MPDVWGGTMRMDSRQGRCGALVKAAWDRTDEKTVVRAPSVAAGVASASRCLMASTCMEGTVTCGCAVERRVCMCGLARVPRRVECRPASLWPRRENSLALVWHA